jgi:hypothetical protein
VGPAGPSVAAHSIPPEFILYLTKKIPAAVVAFPSAGQIGGCRRRDGPAYRCAPYLQMALSMPITRGTPETVTAIR